MEIQLRNTSKIVTLNGVPARIWEGYTASGIRIHCFIARVAVDKTEDFAELESELKSMHPPSVDVAVYPLHLLI